jgi:hypothetical protein
MCVLRFITDQLGDLHRSVLPDLTEDASERQAHELAHEGTAFDDCRFLEGSFV